MAARWWAWWCPHRPAARSIPRIQALWEDSDKFQDPALVLADAQIGMAFGDSTMLQTGRGLAAWGNETGRLVLPYAALTDALGCSVSRGGERRSRGDVGASPWAATAGPTTIPPRPAPPRGLRAPGLRRDPDRAVGGHRPAHPRRRPVAGPGDPVYDDFLYREFAARDRPVHRAGLVVVWVLSPHIDVGRNEEPPPRGPLPRIRPQRMDRLNEIVGAWPTSARGGDRRPAGLPVRTSRRRDGRGLRPTACTSTLQTAYEVADGLAGPGGARRHRRRAQPAGAPEPPTAGDPVPARHRRPRRLSVASGQIGT